MPQQHNNLSLPPEDKGPIVLIKELSTDGCDFIDVSWKYDDFCSYVHNIVVEIDGSYFYATNDTQVRSHRIIGLDVAAKNYTVCVKVVNVDQVMIGKQDCQDASTMGEGNL